MIDAGNATISNIFKDDQTGAYLLFQASGGYTDEAQYSTTETSDTSPNAPCLTFTATNSYGHHITLFIDGRHNEVRVKYQGMNMLQSGSDLNVYFNNGETTLDLSQLTTGTDVAKFLLRI